MAIPAAELAVAAPAAAKRLWGGLVESLGKETYRTVTIRQGRRIIHRESSVLGVTRIRDSPLGGPKQTVEIRSVQRWEVVPIAVVAVAAIAVAAAETSRGQEAIGRIRGSSYYRTVQQRYSELRHPVAYEQAKSAQATLNALNPMNWFKGL